RCAGVSPRRILVPVLLFAGLAVAMPAHAQSGGFGQNKIQYTDFKWRVLASKHFDLYYYPEEDTLAHTALRIAEEAYDGLSARMRHEVTRRIPLIIYSSHNDFEQTNVSPSFLPEGVGGFTEFLKGRVALPYQGSYSEFEHVIWHELTHVFQLSRVAEEYRLHYRNAFVTPPLWFTEGMAEDWSSHWDSTGELFLSDMVLHDRLPDIPDLWRYSGTFVIYKIGQDLVGYLEKIGGPDAVPAIYDELWRVSSFEQALERVTGMSLQELNERWHLELKRRYYPRVQNTEPMALAAHPLATKGPNFQAATPPDSGVIASDTYYFMSPRDGFMTIYQGSTKGREVDVRRVIRGERNPEFESFHGFESRLAVSKDGVIAFVSKYQERDGLFLYDLRNHKLIGKWQFKDLVSLRSPSFRPDGKAVVFTGLRPDGRQDLYLFETNRADVVPLTNDRYMDDDATWSPDGTKIAFISDRGAGGDKGGRNVFLYDVDTRRVEPLTQGPWRDSAPSWDSSGKRIAFASDREGVSQIYVADSTRASVRVTSVQSGAMSPVWDPKGRHLLFTGMNDLGFGIYRSPVKAVGDTLPPPVSTEPMYAWGIPDTTLTTVPLNPAVWTWNAGSDTVVARESNYKTRYTLDFAQGGVALEPVQGAGEGLQLLLSDQLGDQLIFFNLSNTATDFGDLLGRFNVGVSYLNQRRRIHRGFSAFHLAGDFLDERGFQYFERRVGGVLTAVYPYSRFSRVEAALGMVYSDRSADSFRPARTAPLAVNYLSFVYDNALWFSTGPMDGTSYRLTLGLNTNLEKVEIENVSAALDLRKYFRTSLRTAYAARLLARASEGTLPQRFVLGGSWSFRGYPERSLVGTRSLLLNQEWRFPLLSGGILGLPIGALGLPPVQGATFFDVGQSWEEGHAPHDLLGSFGLGFRMSLGGLIVLRLDVAKLTDFRRVRPGTEVDFFVGYNY
ncbi:MAG TPA: ShlB/FhaC/HecB family hemolysin secretion/activation protein, partial [Dongiaceae bacterium]|nr:ShlB/FhaC/HecB family hemolysin secretion/activation protein [Dongiaceae bacterium]